MFHSQRRRAELPRSHASRSTMGLRLWRRPGATGALALLLAVSSSAASAVELRAGGVASGPRAETAQPPGQAVLDRLDAAWDAMDGARFASEFTEDADVININGSRFVGRADLARQMQFLFDGRFKGSRHSARTVEHVQDLAPGLILIVSSAAISTPAGGDLRSRQSFILQSSGERWLIRHWHNTPIRDAREGAPTQ